MTNDFPAHAQALGYIFQIFRYSLYVVLQNVDNLHKGINIEKFDDIEIVDGNSVDESLQIKRVKTNLTNRSSDLWKTIRLWCEGYNQGALKLPDTLLTLVTTAKASDGSIASLLHSNRRDCDQALELLRKEACNPSKTLAKAFAAFNQLNPVEQHMLVNCIYIADCAPDISEIVDLIKNRFVGVHPENRDEVYSLLEQWWFDLVIDHLQNKSSQPISISSVVTKIADINHTVKPPKLEDPFFDLQVPDNYVWDTRIFVRQLTTIKLPEPLIARAVHDFYRAGKLRNWLVDELHLLKLSTYDQKLKEEWELYFYSQLDEHVHDNCDEDMLCSLGRKIYNDIQKTVSIPIHDNYTDKYITRGSYQVLADNVEHLDIGWHPQYKEKIVNRSN